MELKNKTDQSLLGFEPKKMENLHQECLTWISEIEFWDLELNFFQKLLNKGYKEKVSTDDDFTNEVMEGKLIRFKQEAIDEFKVDITSHLNCLDDLIDTKSEINEDMHRENHVVYENHILKLERRFKAFKKELFEYILSLNR